MSRRVFFLLLASLFVAASAHAQAPGTLYQLQQWVSTSSPSAITQAQYGKALKITGLTPLLCLTLDANNLLTTTSCGSGGSVATSSSETAGQIPYYTSTAGGTALISGGSSLLTFNGTKLTATFASTTAISADTASSTSLFVSGNINFFGTNSTAVTGTGSVVLSASPTFSGTVVVNQVTATTLRGGTGVGSVLTIRGSVNAAPTFGTAGIVFQGGNGGTVEAARFEGRSNRLGVGTTTPQWAVQIATSTPQLALSDGSLTSVHWVFDNINGNFYIATASPSTYATSTVAALAFDTNGFPTFGQPLGVASGGTGSTTLTGILGGNGTSAIKSVVIGSGLTFDGTTLATAVSGSSFPFTPATNYGVNTSATTTPIWAQAGLFASSSTAYPTLAVAQAGTGPAATFLGGNVGIASSSPNRTLVVLGTARNAIGNGTAFFGANGTGGGLEVSVNSSGVTTLQGASPTNNASKDISLQPYGSNVGIGTTTPQALLHVRGSNIRTGAVVPNTAALLVVENGATNGINILSTSATKGFVYFGDEAGAQTGRIEYDHSNDSMAFFAGTEKMRITNAGNVGIGTTTPQRLLEVTNSGTQNQIIVEDTGAAADAHLAGIGYSRGVLNFDVLNDALATTTLFNAFNSTLGLGLGTTSPWRTLGVTGTVGFDGLPVLLGGAICLDANKQVVNCGATTAITVAATTIANTTASSSMFTSATWATRTIPANSITAGTKFCLNTRGIYSTTLTPNFIVRLVLGNGSATTTVAQVTSTGLGTSVTSQGIKTDACLTFQTSGASATVQGNLNIAYATGAGNTTDFGRGSATVDTTSALTLDATLTWSAASASDTATIDQADSETIK